MEIQLSVYIGTCAILYVAFLNKVADITYASDEIRNTNTILNAHLMYRIVMHIYTIFHSDNVLVTFFTCLF